MEEKKNINENRKQKNATTGWKLKGIFFGDVLVTDFFRRQTKLLVLVVILTIFYISNRYSCQQELIRIAVLNQQLTEIRYNALTRSSELMEKSRQSRIEEYVAAQESDLQTSTTPPYLIKE